MASRMMKAMAGSRFMNVPTAALLSKAREQFEAERDDRKVYARPGNNL